MVQGRCRDGAGAYMCLTVALKYKVHLADAAEDKSWNSSLDAHIPREAAKSDSAHQTKEKILSNPGLWRKPVFNR